MALGTLNLSHIKYKRYCATVILQPGLLLFDVRQTRSSNLNDTVAMHSKTIKFGNICPLILRGSLH